MRNSSFFLSIEQCPDNFGQKEFCDVLRESLIDLKVSEQASPSNLWKEDEVGVEDAGQSWSKGGIRHHGFDDVGVIHGLEEAEFLTQEGHSAGWIYFCHVFLLSDLDVVQTISANLLPVNRLFQKDRICDFSIYSSLNLFQIVVHENYI